MKTYIALLGTLLFLASCNFSIPAKPFPDPMDMPPVGTQDFNVANIDTKFGDTKGGTTITLTGKGLTQDTKVTVGDKVAVVKSASADGTSLQFTLPASPGTVGKKTITLMNTKGMVVELKDVFTYYLGNISFTSMSSAAILSSTSPLHIAVANLDNDANNIQDLAIVNMDNRNVDILVGDGQGNFSLNPILQFNFGGTYHNFSATGDFNNDGLTDLAIISPGDSLIALAQKRPGATNGFVIEGNIGSGNIPNAIVLVDLDGDNRLDIAAANTDTTNMNRLSVYRNNTPAMGVVTYLPPQKLPLPTAVSSLLAADLNKDGKVDLVAASSTSFHALLNTGMAATLFAGTPADQAFSGFTPQAGFFAPLSMTSSSNQIDLAFVGTDGTNKTMAFYDNTSPGTSLAFTKNTASVMVESGVGNPASSLAMVDFNKDGYNDFVVTSGSTIRVYLSKALEGKGLAFADAIVFQTVTPTVLRDMKLVDTNADGLMDIVTISRNDAKVYVFQNSSN